MIVGKQKVSPKLAKHRVKPKSTRKLKIPFLSKILVSKKRKTALMSGTAGAAILIIAFQVYAATGNTQIRDLGMIGGIVIGILPPMMIDLGKKRRREGIDSNLPIFLLSIVSAVQSGSTIMRAIEEAADRNLGGLTPELKNLRANLSWGMPYEEAFDQFIKRVDTVMARRVMILLQVAIKSGGETVSTLEMIQKHVTEMQNIEKERKSALAPYIYTIYIAFVIFIAISIMLVSNFFTQIEDVQEQLTESAKKSNVPLGMFGALLGVDVDSLTQLMFNMSLIEAGFGGAAAGKIGEGSFMAGIKHAIIMVIIAILAFQVMGSESGQIVEDIAP